MIEAIKRFFEQNIVPPNRNEAGGKQAVQIATAALLLETARADFNIEHDELDAVAQGLRKTFGLTQQDTDELVQLAELEAKQATCYYEFTSLINREFSAAQKVQIIETMWRVAFSDDRLEKYEEALIRKVADLIYVPHADFIAAKHRVQAD